MKRDKKWTKPKYKTKYCHLCVTGLTVPMTTNPSTQWFRSIDMPHLYDRWSSTLILFLLAKKCLISVQHITSPYRYFISNSNLNNSVGQNRLERPFISGGLAKQSNSCWKQTANASVDNLSQPLIHCAIERGLRKQIVLEWMRETREKQIHTVRGSHLEAP